MDEKLSKYINEPFVLAGRTLARAQKVLGVPKVKRQASTEVASSLPGMTRSELKERQAKEISKKQETLLDYYAGTTVPAERVARHCGFFTYEDAEGKDGNPTRRRVLDVQRARAALKLRRDKI